MVIRGKENKEKRKAINESAERWLWEIGMRNPREYGEEVCDSQTETNVFSANGGCGTNGAEVIS